MSNKPPAAKNPFLPKTTHQPKTLRTDATVTVAIPTAGNSPYLAEATKRWNAQTVNTLIEITSTDTTTETYHLNNARNERTANVITNHIGRRHWKSLSEPIALALDLAQTTASTEWLLHTHDDVIPQNPEVLITLIHLALKNDTPLIGYQMSNRDHITDEWRGMPSHTLTLIHLPTILQNQLHWHQGWNTPPQTHDPYTPGWPDTETFFGRRIKQLNFAWSCLGEEPNSRDFADDLIYHRRSHTSHATHFPQLLATPTHLPTNLIKEWPQ